MKAKLIDVSHAIEEGLITYKGLPAPLICDFLSYENSHQHYSQGTEFQIGKIEMVANTGTYIDVPSHRYRNGKDLSKFPLQSLANLDCIVIRIKQNESRAINSSAFENRDLNGKALLVSTGWSKHWKTNQYFEGHPFLTKDAAKYLKNSGVKLVGIDSLNIDDTNDKQRPVHSILLKNEIPIIEHLTNLQSLPIDGFKFFAVPVKVKGMGSFPVRAFGIVGN